MQVYASDVLSHRYKSIAWSVARPAVWPVREKDASRSFTDKTHRNMHAASL